MTCPNTAIQCLYGWREGGGFIPHAAKKTHLSRMWSKSFRVHGGFTLTTVRHKLSKAISISTSTIVDSDSLRMLSPSHNRSSTYHQEYTREVGQGHHLATYIFLLKQHSIDFCTFFCPEWFQQELHYSTTASEIIFHLNKAQLSLGCFSKTNSLHISSFCWKVFRARESPSKSS